MKIEQQVCSLELAKRLDELGAKAYSYFEWVKKHGCWLLWDATQGRIEQSGSECGWAPAFTVAELGEMLPKCYITEHRLNGGWECLQNAISTVEGRGLKEQYPTNPISMFATTEADARAKMLIYLLESKLISSDSVS